MEVVMNITRRVLLVSVVLVSMLATALPTYADIIKVVLMPDGVTFKKTGKFKQPTIGGVRIDTCVLGSGWSKSNPMRCDSRRLEVVANDFCKSKGFERAILVSKVQHEGRHAVLTYRKGRPTNSYWKRAKGHSVIDRIYCE